MHKTLERQLIRFYGSVKDAPKEYLEFLELVSKTYTGNDKEYTLMERALDISSKELTEVNNRLHNENKKIEGEVSLKTEELNRSKVHMETIIENLTSGLIEYSDDFTILRINRIAENMLGVKKNDIIGKKVTPESINSKELMSLVRILHPSLFEESRIVKEYTADKNNQLVSADEIAIHYPVERDLHVTTSPIIVTDDNFHSGFIKVFRDVTRERIISRSKSEFISIAAHQLRTPLSAIKWAIWIIMEGDLGPLLPEQIKLLRRGYDTNEKMIVLVNDLLNVARIEDGRFGYEFKEGDISEVVSSSVFSAMISAIEKKITLKFNKQDEKINPFVFDSKKIAIAIQNMIDNAIKYTPIGGTVTVSVEKKDEYAYVCIKDSGVGIPENQQSRLFSKFFRARNVLRIETSGSGLGLFIAKNIISRHGGKIDVKSKEGEGSTFCFSLPVDKNLIPKYERASIVV